MFTVIRNGANRLDIGMSGKMTAEQMKVALDELVGKSRTIENGTMLYDMIDFHLPSLGAIVVEFSRVREIFGFMKKFQRAAVLTDRAWLKKVSEVEAIFYPWLEIKAFDREQKEDAETWLES